MPAATSDDPRLEAYHELVRRTVAGIADETVETAEGWAARTRDLPRVWTLNQVSCTAPATFATLVDRCDAFQADLHYRHLVVRHEPTARAVEPDFAEAGWRIERDVVMALVGIPAVPDGADAVRELTEDQMAALMAAWLTEEHAGIEDPAVEEVLEYNRREGRLFGERCYGVLGDDGRPLAVTKLRVSGSLGWVEDVYTMPDARGRGHARTLVALAARGARAAGCKEVVLVADADDWPQHLYRRIGFEEVGRSPIFHLEVEAASLARGVRARP